MHDIFLLQYLKTLQNIAESNISIYEVALKHVDTKNINRIEPIKKIKKIKQRNKNMIF